LKDSNKTEQIITRILIEENVFGKSYNKGNIEVEENISSEKHSARILQEENLFDKSYFPENIGLKNNNQTEQTLTRILVEENLLETINIELKEKSDNDPSGYRSVLETINKSTLKQSTKQSTNPSTKQSTINKTVHKSEDNEFEGYNRNGLSSTTDDQKQCEHCGKVYGSKSSLDRHSRKKHNIIKKTLQPPQCPICELRHVI
jgi:hypothetical protein